MSNFRPVAAVIPYSVLLVLSFAAIQPGCADNAADTDTVVDTSPDTDTDTDTSPDTASHTDTGIAPDAAPAADTAPALDTDTTLDTDADAAPAKPPPIYPLDNVLRVNHIQAKGTHNSYHLKMGPVTIPQWSYQFSPLAVQLEKQGVRQVELDVHYTPGKPTATWEILHVPFVDAKSTCPTLTACLTELKKWSDDHTGHHILFILIEPKDDVDSNKIEGHYDELDAAMLAVWPKERVLRPDDVRGKHPTLRKALLADGWPTLGATRNKAMFVMLNGGEHRDNYLKKHPNLENRVMFARGGEGEPWSSVLEMGGPIGDMIKIQKAVKDGYLVRTKADSPESSDADNMKKAAAALKSGAQVISCDRPVKEKGSAFVFDVPGGTPSRCNPLIAPPSCTSAAIENL